MTTDSKIVHSIIKDFMGKYKIIPTAEAVMIELSNQDNTDNFTPEEIEQVLGEYEKNPNTKIAVMDATIVGMFFHGRFNNETEYVHHGKIEGIIGKNRYLVRLLPWDGANEILGQRVVSIATMTDCGWHFFSSEAEMTEFEKCLDKTEKPKPKVVSITSAAMLDAVKEKMNGGKDERGND
jgi:hypothetical protein